MTEQQALAEIHSLDANAFVSDGIIHVLYRGREYRTADPAEAVEAAKQMKRDWL